jgi:hypothetical protein
MRTQNEGTELGDWVFGYKGEKEVKIKIKHNSKMEKQTEEIKEIKKYAKN